MPKKILFNDLNIATEEEFYDGDLIFKEGSSGDWIYAIISGRVEIFKQIGGKKVVIDVLEPGDIIGEVSFIDKKVRSASAKALGEVKLGIYDKEFLTREYNKLPGDFKIFFDYLARRLRKMTNVATTLVGRKTDRADKSIEVHFKTAAEFKKAYSSNIGSGGLFIHSDKPLPEQTKVNLKFTLPGESNLIETEGLVAWKKEGDVKGMGVQFTSIKPADEKRVKVFVNKTLGHNP